MQQRLQNLRFEYLKNDVRWIIVHLAQPLIELDSFAFAYRFYFDLQFVSNRSVALRIPMRLLTSKTEHNETQQHDAMKNTKQ